MRLGLLTPVVSLNPRAHNAWEPTATPDDLVTVVRAAEAAGFHHLTCSDHTAVPSGAQGAAGARGTRYWEPFTTLGFLAGQTTTVRLATHVLVLPHHHPLQVLKRVATLQQLSGGRAILGVGVGSLSEEFDALAAPWRDRGAATDRSLATIAAGLAGEPVAGDTGAVIDPSPAVHATPVWVGGRTRRSLVRALRHGSGWAPFALEPDTMASLLSRARMGDLGVEVPPGFDVVCWAEGADDPTGDPSGFSAAADRWAGAGATILNVRVRSSSPRHHAEQLVAAAELV